MTTFSINGQHVPNKAGLEYLLGQLGYTASRGPCPGAPSLMPCAVDMAAGNLALVHIADDLEYDHAETITALADSYEQSGGNAMVADMLKRFALSVRMAAKVRKMSD